MQELVFIEIYVNFAFRYATDEVAFCYPTYNFVLDRLLVSSNAKVYQTEFVSHSDDGRPARTRHEPNCNISRCTTRTSSMIKLPFNDSYLMGSTSLLDYLVPSLSYVYKKKS